MKYIFSVGLCSILLFVGAGCSTPQSANDAYSTTPATSTERVADTIVPSEDVTTTSTPTTTRFISNTKPTSMEFDAEKQYSATLHTSEGDIVIALNHGETPRTVKNFVDLAEKHFYDKTIFHRVIKGFMIQGGDPQGNGMGGPGYQFDDEQFSGDYTRGTVAMANSGPNTNGSQFFIMHATVNLPKNYVIFGHVTAGMDVVDKIASSTVKSSPFGEPSVPITPTVVKSVTITELH